MKSVLISIKPEWCEKIASGEKTVEVRKTLPKINTPFKCYIYCTMGGEWLTLVDGVVQKPNEMDIDLRIKEHFVSELNGKVIGEFVCDFIDNINLRDARLSIYSLESCVNIVDLFNYADGKSLYFWHISNLVIYDKPRGLSEFVVPTKFGCCNEGKCKGCIYFDRGNGFNVEDDCNAPFCTDDYKPLRRPPQSWCYVEVAG